MIFFMITNETTLNAFNHLSKKKEVEFVRKELHPFLLQI